MPCECCVEANVAEFVKEVVVERTAKDWTMCHSAISFTGVAPFISLLSIDAEFD